MQAREAIGVVVRVAEQFVAYPHALHEQPDVEFIGHPDAAVHLHRLLHRLRCAGAGACLRDRDDRARLVE